MRIQATAYVSANAGWNVEPGVVGVEAAATPPHDVITLVIVGHNVRNPRRPTAWVFFDVYGSAKLVLDGTNGNG